MVTPKRLQQQMAAIDQQVAEYLATLDEADQHEPVAGQKGVDVGAALEALKAQRRAIQQQAQEMAEQGLKQKVATEADAKMMRTANQGFKVAYNAQTAVDAKHKLIVAFDLTDDDNDSVQLYPMATSAKEELQVEQVTVVADSGYSNGEQCEEQGITAIVPRAETVNPNGKEYFSREQFTYDAQGDSWQCPAGETLTCFKVSTTQKKQEYTTKASGNCKMKAQCTKANQRVIVRVFYEDAMEAMHQRAMSDPNWMKQRRSIAEHPFGTLKWMMGSPRFLVRGLEKAKAEPALSILSYNLKRVINIKGGGRS